MTLEKAMENLTSHTPTQPPYFDPDFVKALKLGTEALKAIDLARRSRDVRIIDKLPGETP